MAVNKTSLSAGAIIRAVLIDDAEVASRVKKIYPIVAPNAELPYIVYRRAELTANPQKAGAPGGDTIQIEVMCYTAKYTEGVELAEAVRGALDFTTATAEGQTMRSCYLSGSEEGYQDDAFIQQLIFNVKI